MKDYQYEHTWVKKCFKKCRIQSKLLDVYWLLVGLVRSLKSSHKESHEKPLLCDDYKDLTSPTDNQNTRYTHRCSVLYDTL